MTAWLIAAAFAAGAGTTRLIMWRVMRRHREQAIITGRAEGEARMVQSMGERLKEGYELLSGDNGPYWRQP